MSGYHSNEPFSYHSNLSKDNKKQRESFETFGQKSLVGAMQAIKSESRESRIEEIENEDDQEEEKDMHIAPTFDSVEEEKSQTTDGLKKKPLETDDSTDISAQITKRTYNGINSDKKEGGRQSSYSMNALHMDSLTKLPVDGTLTKESQNSDLSSFRKSAQGKFLS